MRQIDRHFLSLLRYGLILGVVCAIRMIHVGCAVSAGIIAFLVIMAIIGILLIGEREKAGHSIYKLSRTVELSCLALLIMCGIFLRIPLLNDLPPGISVDESINGLRALGNARNNYLPIWTEAEKCGIFLFGPTILGVRFPSAVIGVLTIPLSWWVVRSFGGAIPGLASAAFIAGYFPHVQFSRTALDAILIVPLGLLVIYILLKPQSDKHITDAIIMSAICACAFYSYAALLYVPAFVILAIIITRLFFPREKRYSLRFVVVFLVFLGMFLIPYVCVKYRMEYILHGLSIASPLSIMRQTMEVIFSYFRTTPVWTGLWLNFPPGSPRFTVIEACICFVGLAYLLGKRVDPYARQVIVLSLLLSAAPEILPGRGIHLIRGLGAVAPLAVIFGFGAGLVGSRNGKPGMMLIAALCIWNFAESGVKLYSSFSKDGFIRSCYNYEGLETARYIRSLYDKRPVRMYPFPDAESNPIVAFLLYPDIKAGKLLPSPAIPPQKHLMHVVREPKYDIPTIFFFGSGLPETGLTVRILNLVNVFNQAMDTQHKGRFQQAEEEYKYLISNVPRFGSAHLRLARLYLEQKKYVQAKHELELSGKYGGLDSDRPEYIDTLSKLESARKP